MFDNTVFFKSYLKRKFIHFLLKNLPSSECHTGGCKNVARFTTGMFFLMETLDHKWLGLKQPATENYQ